MFASFSNITIRGMSAAVPSNSVTLDELIASADKETAFRLKRTAALAGLRKRHVAPENMFTGDLALTAGKKLLAHLGWGGENLDTMFFISQTPDFLSPPTGYLIAHQLGCSQQCMVNDLSAGCSGMLQGAYLASAMLSPACRRALVLSGDAASKVIPSDDVGNKVLMGDAVGAIVLEYTDDMDECVSFTMTSLPDVDLNLVNYGSGYRPMQGMIDGMSMNGNKITEFCLSKVPQCMGEHLDSCKMTTEDIDVFFLHQPNKAILDTLSRRLKISKNKLPMIFDEYANCSSASLALNVCNFALNQENREPIRAFFAAFGSGLAVSTMLANVDLTHCLPVAQLEIGELLLNRA